MWPLSSSASLAEVSRRKTAVRDEALNKAIKTLGKATEADEKYLRATAVEITRQIESGNWTAVHVTEAFIRRAILAHEKTNCLTEILFDQALHDAAELDEKFGSTKQLTGALHGVPVSFKDQVNIAGYDSTLGYSRKAHKPSASDSEIVKQFREAGAIIIAKTNVPQTTLGIECNNPIWGRTTNPYNSSYTSGGSCGGEAALLAMGGSVFGFGSDIGGSLRVPAAFCGVYTIKPGSGRFSKLGIVAPYAGFETIRTAVGPLSGSVDDLDLVCRTFFGVDAPPEATLVPLRYRSISLPSKLRFGYYTSDLCVKASPASERAVLETVQALRMAGHECVEFKTSLFMELFAVFTAATAADKYEAALSPLGSDPKDVTLSLPTFGPRLPSLLHRTLSWILPKLVKDPFITDSFALSKPSTVLEGFEIVNKRERLTVRFYEEIWNKYGFDAILGPAIALPGLPHDSSSELSPLAVATAIFNVLDVPVGSIPVTRVDPIHDKVTDKWKPGMEGSGSKTLENNIYWNKLPLPSLKTPPTIYDVDLMKGLPVGIQIVGKRWEEEKLLAMMKIVDSVLGERGFGPGAMLN